MTIEWLVTAPAQNLRFGYHGPQGGAMQLRHVEKIGACIRRSRDTGFQKRKAASMFSQRPRLCENGKLIEFPVLVFACSAFRRDRSKKNSKRCSSKAMRNSPNCTKIANPKLAKPALFAIFRFVPNDTTDCQSLELARQY